MSKVLISGYYGFANAGDEAMLAAIVEALKKKEPCIEITVISGNPELTADKHEVYSVHRFNVMRIFQALRRCSLLLSGGGSLLQDVTSKRSILYYLSLLFAGKLLGKKVMLYAQGIGPINSYAARRLTTWICRRVDLITVRDDGSYEELLAMGIKEEQIKVTADAVFALEGGEKERGRRLLKKKGISPETPTIALALRHWSGEERFKRVFAQAVDRLTAKYNATVVFVPLQFPQDIGLAKAVAALCQGSRKPVVLEEGYTTDEYLSLFSVFDLLIGMRLHALVFAALAGKPFLAVSYDPKVDRFVRQMEGTLVGGIDTVTAEEIVTEAEKLWQVTPVKQNAKIAQLRSEAELNVERAINLLKE